MDDELIRQANTVVDGAEIIIENLVVRTQEDGAAKGRIWTDLLGVRQNLDNAMTNLELQEVIRLGTELRSSASQLLRTMPPASQRYLKRDGHTTIKEGTHGEFDVNLAPTHEYEIDGDFRCKLGGKNELIIPHGIHVTLNAHAGNQVIATFDNGVSIIFSDEDFPQDGIPVRGVEERDGA